VDDAERQLLAEPVGPPTAPCPILRRPDGRWHWPPTAFVAAVFSAGKAGIVLSLRFALPASLVFATSGRYGTRVAFPAVDRTDAVRPKEVEMYIGLGTVLVVLLIVVLYMLITGRSA
jgi:hypothetical protein